MSPIRSDRCVTYQVGLTERIPADKVRGGIGQRRAPQRAARNRGSGTVRIRARREHCSDALEGDRPVAALERLIESWLGTDAI